MEHFVERKFLRYDQVDRVFTFNLDAFRAKNVVLKTEIIQLSDVVEVRFHLIGGDAVEGDHAAD